MGKLKKCLGTKKRIKYGIISFVGIVLFIVIASLFSSKIFSDTRFSTVGFNLDKIGELDVASIYYDKILNEEESKKAFGLKIAKENALYVFHLKAQIYYDLTQAKIDHDEKKQTVTVHLPKPNVKLLLNDSDYSIDYEYYKVADSLFIKDENNKGLEIQKKVIENAEQEILLNDDFILMAEESATKILNVMLEREGVKVKSIFD